MKPIEFIIYRHVAGCYCEPIGRAKGALVSEVVQAYAREHSLDYRTLRARKPGRLTDEMAHVLQLASHQGANIWRVPLVNGKGSQSRTVGRGASIEACQRHGWLDQHGQLTQAGREARAVYEARQERRRARA